MKPENIIHFESSEAFRAWLGRHHAERDELWLGLWKKGSGRASITWPESVDEALCFGWIDGIRKRVDDVAYTIRFTPRRPGSTWSHRNIERYEALLAEGRIAPAGAAAFERRTEEKSGVYSFERKGPARLSPSFASRLKEDGAAWRDWQARPPGYRNKATHWIMSAKRDATRERRFEQLLAECRAGRRVKPLRRKID
ncbi:MAG: YdeI/OmpD-associated family protein [Gemmatimonadota bacterium]|nr:YdeI/OmpD-associated family protein [Gemmatimonadota bacterium]